jgi:hypothetical protein
MTKQRVKEGIPQKSHTRRWYVMATVAQKDRALKLAMVIVKAYAESPAGGGPKRTDFAKMLDSLYRKTIELVEDSDREE